VLSIKIKKPFSKLLSRSILDGSEANCQLTIKIMSGAITMRKRRLLFILVYFLTANHLALAGGNDRASLSDSKKSIIQSLDAHRPELIGLSDQIWKLAETALVEHKSSKLLADYAEKQGFRVERGIAGMPTAFIATYGSGKPIIGILGEFDALPGLSQKASHLKEPLQEGAPGHGCGHNLLGVGSLGAAVAIKELLEEDKIKGTVRYYGTPAEEECGGKVYMAREGVFDDLDVCLDWHPDIETKPWVQGYQAVIDLTVEFHGKTAHAAYDPWNGRSALDGLELFTDGVNMYREHVRPSVRIHYVFQKTGDIPNVVPENASVWIWVRDSKLEGVTKLYERIKQIAKGASLMADVDYSVTLNVGFHDLLINRRGAKLLQRNLELLGPLTYTPEEVTFAKQIQQASGVKPDGLDGGIKPLEETKPDPPGGSTDVGDVSWIVPEISLVVTTAPKDVPWHSWAVTACGGMSIGHKGMLYAAKTLAMTMVDLYSDAELIKEVKREFHERKGDKVWKPMIPDGPPPIPISSVQSH
jgi:aminobenzoyl-glutamate utilization protein B